VPKKSLRFRLENPSQPTSSSAGKPDFYLESIVMIRLGIAFFLLLAAPRAFAYEMPNLTDMREMADLCVGMNGSGIEPNPPEILPEEKDGWLLRYEGKAPEQGKQFWGFESYGNRWAVYQKGQTNRYAIVIRGTVLNRGLSPDMQKSIIEDVLALTTKANYIWFSFKKEDESGQIENAIQLSADSNAAVHFGFAYGLIDVLFHRNGNGLLGVLRDKIPDGSEIYITGHSQGAAIATLLHAFLHHRSSNLNSYYGLGTKNFKLKSFVFAQPKPGNWHFAMDFSRGLYGNGNDEVAYVINNERDWVPQAPLSIQGPLEELDSALTEFSPSLNDLGEINAVNTVKAYAGMSIAIKEYFARAMLTSQNLSAKEKSLIYEKFMKLGDDLRVKKFDFDFNSLNVLQNTSPLWHPIDYYNAVQEARREKAELEAIASILFQFVSDVRAIMEKADIITNSVLNKQIDEAYFKQGPSLKPEGFAPGKSIAYMPVGIVIALPLCTNAPPPIVNDPFTQHHMSTYVALLQDVNLKDPDVPKKCQFE
jgi:Lipase (class 3)